MRGSTAHAAWLAVDSQFLGNRETRALYLDAKFRGFSQEDLSITDYCRRLKRMADDLGDLGEIVTDRTLVLNLIRGLGKRFSNIGLHLRRSNPFPSFLEAKDALLLEEPTLAHQSSTPTAFIASQSPSPAPATAGGGASAGRGGAGHGGAPSSSKGRCGKRGSKKGGSGQPGAGGKAPQTASGAPWPTYWNPWTGTIQMWPGPRPSLVPIPQPRPPQ